MTGTERLGWRQELVLTPAGWGRVGALTALHGVYWEALGSVGRLWEPLREVGWSSGVGWGFVFWIGSVSRVRVWISGLGCGCWVGVWVLDWGLSEGIVWVLDGDQESRSEVGIQAGIWVPGGGRSGWGLDCGIPCPRIGSGSQGGIWVLGWDLELRWVWVLSADPDLGRGSGDWVVVGVQGGAPGRVLDAGNGSGSQVGSTSWSRDWVPGGSPGLGSGLHMVSGFCVGVQVQGCGLGPGLGSGSQVGV